MRRVIEEVRFTEIKDFPYILKIYLNFSVI
jgi:hypothetical protein